MRDYSELEPLATIIQALSANHFRQLYKCLQNIATSFIKYLLRNVINKA